MKSSASTANSALRLVLSEAESLLEKAKKYRDEMEGLPPGDPQRQLYDRMIRDLIETSRRMSVEATTRAKSL